MTHSKNIFLAAVSAFALLATVVYAIAFLSTARIANASTIQGLWAYVATTSTAIVGPGNNMTTGFGTTTQEARHSCMSRIISTQGYPIMISFGSISSTTLTTSIGHLQAASTTQEYDGGAFGCGYLTVRGLYASSTITITETN